jgi:Secretion system C-terminal sorting domain
MKPFTYLFIFSLLTLSFSGVAQNEGNIWYFGSNAGIDFNSGVPVALTNGALSTSEGCASISDNNGVLQFYTDGVTVWNRNHLVMPNGTGLTGGVSSTQSAIIAKKPGSSTIYYLFTADGFAEPNGLRYSEVDMSLQGGLGDINSNKNIPIVTPTCEKAAIIRHSNNIDFWIVTHLFNSDAFHSYLFTAAGINATPVVSNVGTSISGALTYIGYLKGSVDGSRIAVANSNMDNAELFDFDNATGLLSNALTFNNFNGPNGGAYGIEFSPNSNLLYVSDASNSTNSIYQYNLLAGSPTAIVNSRTIIGSYQISLGATGWGGALQLGPDNKIYYASLNLSFLGVINNPNLIGSSCNYVANGVSLAGRYSTMGLPSFSNDIYSNPTSINELNTNNYSIYPNPTSNQLNIEINEVGVREINIIDITGKTVKTFTLNFNTINVSDLQKGIYFIKFIGDEKTITKKFIKQ